MTHMPVISCRPQTGGRDFENVRFWGSRLKNCFSGRPEKQFGAFRRAAAQNLAYAPLGPEKRPSLPVLILLAAAPHRIRMVCGLELLIFVAFMKIAFVYHGCFLWLLIGDITGFMFEHTLPYWVDVLFTIQVLSTVRKWWSFCGSIMSLSMMLSLGGCDWRILRRIFFCCGPLSCAWTRNTPSWACVDVFVFLIAVLCANLLYESPGGNQVDGLPPARSWSFSHFPFHINPI